MNELELFAAAVAIVDPIERGRFLDRECATRPELRQRIDRLLDAHFQSHAILDQPLPLPLGGNAPTLKPTVDFPRDHDSAGTVIADKYTLVEVIGEGGMGSVWRAKQTEPVKRFVAVKLIKAGMDSKQVLARFEAERQALALMDHPNIAKVLDGGLHQQRPFFVMELVKGVPITAYCDARKLPPKERLELFVPVCQAIQHAHQKGIIHRDIKPNNVLIAMYDDQPVVKVIDFGVAKATGGTLTEHTIDTGFGAVVGTPQYMSPEQATFNNLDIDTRSDVYALGVLLYELLTGSPPFTQKDLEKKGLLEILRVVREEEPPRPSTKLSTAEALPTLSANRGTDPKQLTGLLKNELDWIVMKALEKDRARRYETANGFAADVLRYLSGEAVQAHPPTTAYRLKKFVLRNQFQVVATSFVLLSLLAGVIGTTFGLWRAEQRRNEAEQAHEDERKQRRIAEAKTAEAQEHEAMANRARQETLDEKIKSDIKAIGLQVDLDLIECKTDPKVGLLRLSQQRDTSFEFKTWNVPINDGDGNDWPSDWSDGYEATTRINYSDRPDYRPLKEFVTAAVIATGQQYASLLPPIPGEIVTADENPNLLSLDKDGVPRLFDLRSGREIADLRVGKERIVNCGLSPDGRWAFTDDLASVLRIWDARSGQFVSALAPRENRYGNPEGTYGDWRRAVLIEGNRVITRRCIVEQKDIGSGGRSVGETWAGPVELWDIPTGQCILRLDKPGSKIEAFRFEAEGKLIPILEDQTALVLYSAEDGRETARFKCPNNQPIEHYAVSSSGDRVAIVSDRVLWVWDSSTPQAIPPGVSLELPNVASVQFLSDELIGVKTLDWGPQRELVFRREQALPVFERRISSEAADMEAIGPIHRDSSLRFENTVFDAQTGKPLTRPSNRKYHPLLATFAKDGRFVLGARWNSDGFARYRNIYAVDTVTEKTAPLPIQSTDPIFVSGLGYVWEIWTQDTGNHPCLLPSLDLDAIPLELLQQWAKLVVRGELAEDGSFLKWDESTWEKKRQELAAVPPPIKDFPFPGHVAQDRLHWLRVEFSDTQNDADRLGLAEQLLVKAISIGDQAESNRWRKESKQLADKLAKPIVPDSESTNNEKPADHP